MSGPATPAIGAGTQFPAIRLHNHVLALLVVVAAVTVAATGFVAVAPTLQSAVFRAIFTEVSARVQLQAATLGGPMAAHDEEEGRKADAINLATVGRSWELWKSRVQAPARVHHGEDEE